MGSQRIDIIVKLLARLSERLPRWIFDLKVQMLLDAVAATAAIIFAFLIRFEFRTAPWYPGLFVWLPILAILRPLTLLALNTYRSTWRHFHLADGLDLALKSLPLTLAVLLFRGFQGFGSPLQPLPYSVGLIEFNLFVMFAGGVRALRRLTSTPALGINEPVYNSLLVADEESLAGSVRLVEPYPDVQLAGIITHDPKMLGHTVAGVPVLGGPESLQKMIVMHGVDLVLMASANCKEAEQVVAAASELGVQVRILPTARDLVRGRVRVSHFLQAEQLSHGLPNLCSEPHPEVVSCFDERCVLVTGAGGSIGSEISRQVSQLPVAQLILLDQDENSVFELMNELSEAPAAVVSYVGDIRDTGLLKQIFASHMPEVVIHAAAYKHVSVMESNPCEAILNNITGTRQLVEVAEDFNCERFVMISTDKAVRPSSIMGATKRTAEVLVQHRAKHSGKTSRTQFACVRFGNVMGSRGSVAPIFLRQIAAGGPVTVTHEQMTRYFMSIPQAVQLVLQAATLASDGDIYMLDMGDPVKIIDFARRLIRMSGLTPEKDIAIEIVGTRPGEKIHEQLWSEGADVSRTDFPYVFRVKATTPPTYVADEISRLERSAVSRAELNEIQHILHSLPIDYCLDQDGRFLTNGAGHNGASRNGDSRVESSSLAGDD